jgi:lysine biosynthesis protein LysW
VKSSEPSVMGSCPDCQFEVDLGPEPHLGQNVTCPECWAYLKVINLQPVELVWDIEELDEEDESD